MPTRLTLSGLAHIPNFLAAENPKLGFTEADITLRTMNKLESRLNRNEEIVSCDVLLQTLIEVKPWSVPDLPVVCPRFADLPLVLTLELTGRKVSLAQCPNYLANKLYPTRHKLA